jgi:hypothetical protein
MALRQALTDLGADAWLLYDFHGVNPVVSHVLGLRGLATRRARAQDRAWAIRGLPG